MSEEEMAIKFLKKVIEMSKNDLGEDNPFQILMNLIEKQKKVIDKLYSEIEYEYAGTCYLKDLEEYYKEVEEEEK